LTKAVGCTAHTHTHTHTHTHRRWLDAGRPRIRTIQITSIVKKNNDDNNKNNIKVIIIITYN